MSEMECGAAALAMVLSYHGRATRVDQLRGLLHAALDLDGGRFVSTYRFVRALKQGRLKAPPQVPAGAVQLLSLIHI